MTKRKYSFHSLCSVGQSLISAHCKRAIEQFVAHSLIAKERLSDLSLICSLQMSERAKMSEK